MTGEGRGAGIGGIGRIHEQELTAREMLVSDGGGCGEGGGGVYIIADTGGTPAKNINDIGSHSVRTHQARAGNTFQDSKLNETDYTAYTAKGTKQPNRSEENTIE